MDFFSLPFMFKENHVKLYIIVIPRYNSHCSQGHLDYRTKIFIDKI